MFIETPDGQRLAGRARSAYIFFNLSHLKRVKILPLVDNDLLYGFREKESPVYEKQGDHLQEIAQGSEIKSDSWWWQFPERSPNADKHDCKREYGGEYPQASFYYFQRQEATSEGGKKKKDVNDGCENAVCKIALATDQRSDNGLKKHDGE